MQKQPLRPRAVTNRSQNGASDTGGAPAESGEHTPQLATNTRRSRVSGGGERDAHHTYDPRMKGR